MRFHFRANPFSPFGRGIGGKGKEMKKRKRGSERGFTLVEIMIVIIIIGLMAALVGPKLFGKLASAKQKAAKAQIELFGTALDAFRLDVGRYPSTEEGLKALREKPSGADNWEGPYLPKEIPLDPWGRPYTYKCPGEHGEYDLISYGLDGVEGGDGENQDIVSWKDIGK
jgi:general secretion pathway protein G